MSVINRIMKNNAAALINSQINELPDRAKFRASSALRSLQWANSISDAGMPIPACFCALHATEEAVAAFISCAKECGYADAKNINIKDHAAKATISVLTQKISDIIRPNQVAVALDLQTNALVARYIVDGQTYHNYASTKLFHFRDEQGQILSDFHDELVNMFGDVAELEKTVKFAQDARNEIFYATSKGLPTGFDEPEASLARECQLSLSLIWAALDIKRNEGELIPFIEQALQTANIVITDLKSGRTNTKQQLI
ncbi:hypothetical protein [Cohaesibacter haloalkalitolerans]|uniref:hypothetical protein n=1 Tax=Cohaesibacter haloalkalitolerans TaxID=1162980 RepID=UPI000E64F21E|nr:hypothetical protein [Cohaesibacter haloalkalitolerans]